MTQKATEEAKETVSKAKEETKEAVTKTKEETKQAAAKVEETAGKKQPGFDAIFALASLLAVAFAFGALKRKD